MNQNKKEKRSFHKSAIALISVAVVILFAAWTVPNYCFTVADNKTLSSVSEFNAAGIILNFELDEQVNIDRLSELTRLNHTSNPLDQTEEDEMRYYADILLEQLDLLHKSSVITADILNELLPATNYAEPELKIVLIETDRPETYQIVYECNKIYCSILFDAEWNKAISLSIVITDPTVEKYSISNELALRGYIDWLELGGLYDWSYSTSTINAISHSKTARLSLLVYSEIEDEMLKMNVRFMEA